VESFWLSMSRKAATFTPAHLNSLAACGHSLYCANPFSIMPLVRRYGKSDGEAAYETCCWTHGRIVHAYIARACIVNVRDAKMVCAEKLCW